LFVIYTIAAIVLSVLIESIRIRVSYGKIENINKVVSFTIGTALFGVCLALIYTDYYYTPNPLEVGLYGIFYASIRGVLYDPLLNLWTDKELDYVSTKTNSVIDWIERVGLKWGFWTERFVYLLLAILTGLLYATIYA
jgi:hypothetical protein